MESKDRAIYYLERDMDSRSRALGKLRLRSTNLSQVASKQNFGTTIDAKLAEVERAQAATEALRQQVSSATLDKNHATKLKDVYERVTAKIQKLGNVNPEKVVELLQAELNTVETQNGQNKQLLIDLNGALTAQDQQVETLRGQSRALEQYRVEAIFRIFSMKGQCRILQKDIDVVKEKRTKMAR